MSTWEYRLVRRVTGDEEQFDIREIYYDDAGEIEMWAKTPYGPGGATLDEVRADLRLMAAAMDQPVIEFEHLPGRPDNDSGS